MRFTAWLVLAATLLLWSGNWIVARAVREDISPGLATIGRLIIVLAILGPFALRGLRGKLPLLRTREWLRPSAPRFPRGGPPLPPPWVRGLPTPPPRPAPSFFS